MPTDFGALDAITPLPPHELPRQWVLTRHSAEVPDQWTRRELHGWHLGAHEDAKVCDIRAADGSWIGWIIEPLAHLGERGGSVPKGELVLPVTDEPTAEQIEAALYGRDDSGTSTGQGVEGMWVAIVLTGRSSRSLQRVYLGAIHSVVYSPSHRVVATTHNLVPDPVRDVESSRAFDPLESESYFTFGLTAFEGLHRLLPNHYLDLGTFSAERHWPRRPFEPLADGPRGAMAIVEHSRRLIDILSREHPAFRVFLSAGHDSRAVLAMLRPHVDVGGEVVLATTVGPDLPSRIDGQAARRLAAVAGLPHEIGERQAHVSDDSAVMAAFVRIGESKSGPILSAPRLRPGHRHVPDERFVLSGMAGETGRGYMWGDLVGHREALSPDDVVAATESPRTPRVLEAAARWLAGLPEGMSVSSTLDLLYVEQRLGCWESSTRYLFPGRPKVTSPMAAGHNIETMLRLPEDYRAAKLLQRDMVAYGWPELLQVPFNTPTGTLRARQLARSLPRRVRRRMPGGAAHRRPEPARRSGRGR